jgi:hypothetical protein
VELTLVIIGKDVEFALFKGKQKALDKTLPLMGVNIKLLEYLRVKEIAWVLVEIKYVLFL